MSDSNQVVINDTRRWMEQAVIGLNLCPFAKSVHVKGQIHYAVCLSQSLQDLIELLKAELLALQAANPEVRDTTLLMAPKLFQDFLDFNDFLAEADRLLDELELTGEIQIASFHPQFQFAGVPPEDITNATNWSPYPTLHLIREASIDRAVTAFPNPETIFETNMKTLQKLGYAGWRQLKLDRTLPT